MFDIDGVVRRDHELKEVLTQLGEVLTDDDIREMIIWWTRTKMVVVDFDERHPYAPSANGRFQVKMPRAKNLRDVFRYLDVIKSDLLIAKEMGSLMKKLASLKWKHLKSQLYYEEVDIDGDRG
jgi:Ca2+-binding EF-hand superfamily protein